MKTPFFNAYELLGVQPNATPEEIKKAYKKNPFNFIPTITTVQNLPTPCFK